MKYKPFFSFYFHALCIPIYHCRCFGVYCKCGKYGWGNFHKGPAKCGCPIVISLSIRLCVGSNG